MQKRVQTIGAGTIDGVRIRADDDKRFSLLMATFSEKSAADAALKIAAERGVRSAIVAVRQDAPQHSTIEVRGSDADVQALAELAAAYKGLTPVECAAR